MQFHCNNARLRVTISVASDTSLTLYRNYCHRPIGLCRCSVDVGNRLLKLEFHDADTDTDTDTGIIA